MEVSTKNTFIKKPILAGITTGEYEEALTDSGERADFVRVWASVEKNATLTVYYAQKDDFGNFVGEVTELYSLQPNTTNALSCLLNKPDDPKTFNTVWVKISITTVSDQIVTVQTKYMSRVPYLIVNTDNIKSVISVVNNPTPSITQSIPTSDSGASIQAYAGDIPWLCDGSGKLIMVTTATGPLSIIGPIGITGPLTVSGPVFVDGNVPVQNEVTISGSFNCNINAGQKVFVSGTMIMDGDLRVDIETGQQVGITGAVSITGTVNLDLADQELTIVKSDPVPLTNINCNINVNQYVGITGSALDVIMDISGKLGTLNTALTNDVSGSNGNLFLNVTLSPWAVSNPFNCEQYGINSFLTYSDSGTSDTDIVILGSISTVEPAVSPLSDEWEYIGILALYRPSVYISGRNCSTKINLAPFKWIAIQNFSNIECNGARCTVYCNPVGFA
jgi:hypothetical protein